MKKPILPFLTVRYYPEYLLRNRNKVICRIIPYLLQMSLLFMTLTSFAQKLYFPKTYYSDSITSGSSYSGTCKGADYKIQGKG